MVAAKEDAMVGAEEVKVDLGEDMDEAVTEDGEADVDVAAVVIGEAMVTEMEFTRRTEGKSLTFLKKFFRLRQERPSSKQLR